MAVVKCKECGGQVSTKAESCPSCGAKAPKKTSRVTWLVLIVIALLVYQAVSNDAPPKPAAQAAAPVAKAPPKPKGPAPIDPSAFNKYTVDQYPRTVKQWGAEGVKRIEAHERAAADLIATSPKCDEVSMIGLSEQRSSPPGNIVVFVDCSNGERFYVGPNDLKAAPVAQSQKAVGHNAATQACREAVRASSKFPSSVDFNTLGQRASTQPTTGNTVVELDFEAKNGFGNLIPQTARCIFPADGKPEITILNR